MTENPMPFVEYLNSALAAGGFPGAPEGVHAELRAELAKGLERL